MLAARVIKDIIITPPDIDVADHGFGIRGVTLKAEFLTSSISSDTI